MLANRLVFLFLLLLFTGTTSVFARVVSPRLTSFQKQSYSSYYQHNTQKPLTGLFANNDGINWTDPTGRFGKSAFTAAKQNITDFSHSIADTVINVAPGGISALSSVMGYGMDLLGMPSGHLHAQATSINEVLSPYARAGSYDPNSLVSNLVAAGSLVAVPSSAGSRVPSIAAKTATKPLLGSPAGQAGVKALHGGPTSAVASTSIAPYFPANSGFIGQTEKKFLMPDQVIDRHGGTGYSRFFSPAGTPEAARSLPIGSTGQPLRTFEVMKPFEVNAGTIAPAFGQPGFGQQIVTPVKLETLLKRGILKETTLP